MPRYKLTIEYDGTGLSGWQRQNEFHSVQGAIEKALFRASQENSEVYGSGRTDAGVHALEQIAHVDLNKEWDAFRLKEALNYYLRGDETIVRGGQVAILAAEQVSDEFHARFSATKRHYIYRIINRRAHLTLENNRAWCVNEELDAEAMNAAAQIFVGKHDFTSFRSTECQSKSPEKTLDAISLQRTGDLIEMRVSAPSFLHHQVRNLIGTLRLVGNGKWQEKDLKAALAARDRKAAGETAQACGLYLVKIDY